MRERLIQGWRRFRRLFRRHAVEADMQEEFRHHLQLETEHLMATRGLTAEEAARAARISFGGAERFAERSRDVRGVGIVEEVWRDTQQSVRLLLRNPLFAGVAVTTLAVGTGALAAIFAVLNSVVLQPLPYADADRLVAVHHRIPERDAELRPITAVMYHHYRSNAGGIEELAVYRESALNLAGEDGARRIRIANASPELFRILGVQPVLGRLFNEADWTGTSMDVTWTIPVLLSYDFWQSRFGGDPAIIGSVLRINDTPREVFGVLPAGFDFPHRETQAWVMDIPPEPMGGGAIVAGYSAIGRLRAGTTPAAAQLEYASVRRALVSTWVEPSPESLMEEPVVAPLQDFVVGESGRAIWTVFGGMLLLLLVACANVANLFAVRAETRTREVAIRAALGAGRRRLARLFLAESLIVSLTGAAAGLVLAHALVRGMIVVAPQQLPRLHEVRLDEWTIVFTAVLGLLIALALGSLSLARHLLATRQPLALRRGRGSTGPDLRQRRLLDGMIAAQVALTLALLAGSALMLRTYQQMMAVERGFQSREILTVEVALPFRLATRHQQVYDDLATAMRALPGVTQVGGASAVPLSGGSAEHPIRVALPHDDGPSMVDPVALRYILPGYFQAMQTSVLSGFGFSEGEVTEHESPVIISEALARRLFPDGDAIGGLVERLSPRGEPTFMFDVATRERVRLPAWTVAGVVGNVRDSGLQAHDDEVLYVPVMTPRVERSFMPLEMVFVLRTTLPPLALADAARSAVYSVDPSVSIARIRPMDDIVAAATASERFLAVLLLFAAGSSLLLGAVGIYGVAAYTVRRRTAEIGVRMALGAQPLEVTGMVVAQTMAVVAVGAIAGLFLAVLAGRSLEAVLFGVTPNEPSILLAVTVLLLLVAAGACVGPAARAAGTDPAATLRAE